MSTRTVLNEADITRALTRISHEILESNRARRIWCFWASPPAASPSRIASPR